MLKIIGQTGAFDIAFEGKESATGIINGNAFEWDLRSVGGNRFHAILNNRSYNLEVIRAIPEEKQFEVKVNGNNYLLNVKDRYDALLDQLGMSNLNASKVSNIKAPMPGLVLDVLIEEGTAVKKGDAVVILEAMKMENILKSPADGTVKAVKVEKGKAVEKNEVIVNFE